MRLFVAFLSVCVSVAAAADVVGKWDVIAKTASGREYKLELNLARSEGKLSGTISSDRGTASIEDAQLNGDELTYKVAVNEGTYQLKLTVAGDSMKGTFTSPDGSTGSLAATRFAASSNANSVVGKWKFLGKSGTGREYNLVLTLSDQAGKLAGTFTTLEGDVVTLHDINYASGQLSFKVSVDEGTYNVKLAVEGASMKGNYTGPGGENGSVTADRQ
jgi:hypothetical protein